MTDTDPFVEGYRDGRDPECPSPNGNRDPRYVHSFRVGRAELAGRPIPAEASRMKAHEIEEMLSENKPSF